MTNSVIDAIVELENLHWAWEKLKYFYSQEDFWSDELEIATFQANYENELRDIIKNIKRGRYKLSLIKPIFFPKTADKDGNAQNRQMFWISLKDQLVWLAVMNIIGKYYDAQMPYWSYGNRLYISMFPDKEKSTEKKIVWGFGPYRNTTKKTYKSFGQSWPRFRKDIYITSKIITNEMSNFTEEENDDIRINEQLSEVQKVKYKEEIFWSNTNSSDSDIYWCSLDLRKFYPNAKSFVILQNFEQCGSSIKERFNDFEQLMTLLKSLLTFKIDFAISSNYKDIKFEKIELDKNIIDFDGIPTGLFTAGFLSNIAMLEMDTQLNKVIEENSKTTNRVALFRFVDDYTILSPSFDASLDLINKIKEIISTQFENELNINFDKTKPEALKDYLVNKEEKETKELRTKAVKSMKLDSHFPTPLMNHTLKKISMSNQISFELLDATEEKNFLQDIEHLLITDISEEEIREDTRLSFASSKLSILVPKKKYDYTKIYNIKCGIKAYKEKIYKLENQDSHSLQEQNDLEVLHKKLVSFNDKLQGEDKILNDNIQKDRKRTSILLEYAIVNYPDKLKLWKNLINFYKNIGFSHYKEYKELDSIPSIIKKAKSSNKINEYTNEYLITYIYNVLQNSIISVTKRLKSTNISEKEKKVKKTFYNKIVSNQEFLKSPDSEEYSSYYYRQSKKLFELTLIISQYYLSDNNDYLKYFSRFDDNTQLQYYCWMIEKFDIELSKPFIEYYLTKNDISSNLGYYLASLYPSIKLLSFNKILSIKQNKFFPFSWWFYYFSLNNFNLNFEKINNGDAKNAIKLLNSKHKIQIFDYIDNPKINLSEEKSLQIIKQIISEYNVILEDISNRTSKDKKVIQQFPYNIYINDETNEPKVEIHNIYNLKIKDKRYLPDFVDFDVNDQDKQFIYGIGILLYQLTTREKNLPMKLYNPSRQLIDNSYFINNLNEYPISSFSYEIIKACVSKRNRELEKLDIEYFEDTNFQDEDKNSIKIGTIEILLTYIKKSIEFLENKKYINGKQTRYLIPKKLFALTSNFENNSTEDKTDHLKIGYIQINFDNMTAWGPSNDITLSIKDEVENFIWQEILKGFHKLNNHHTKPDIIVIPELTIPNPYIYDLKKLAKEINAVVFAGLDWQINDNKIENKAIMIVPNNWNTNLKSTYCNSTFLGKKNPANLEKISIEEYNKANGTKFKFIPDDNMYLIDAQEFGKIGFAICADFYDIERFMVYKGRVQHIIILALNQDTNSFFAISEAVARLVMCNVVICNTGLFGDSLAFSPYKDSFKRMIYRNQGANLFSTQVIDLPVKSLIDDQKQSSDIENIHKIKFFKMPPKYEFMPN